jgi:hypothetical protein
MLISSFFVGVEVRVILKKTKSNRNKSFTCFLHLFPSHFFFLMGCFLATKFAWFPSTARILGFYGAHKF